MPIKRCDNCAAGRVAQTGTCKGTVACIYKMKRTAPDFVCALWQSH